MKLINKLYITGLLYSISVMTLIGQIGIYTEYIPQNTLLIIDARKDNSLSGLGETTKTLNDIVVSTATGNVGIGTRSPQTKLHMKTGGVVTAPIMGLRIDDGNIAENRVLRSDNNGKGLWVDYTPGVMLGQYPSTGINIYGDQSVAYSNTGASIKLEPGKWLVTFTFPIEVSGPITTIEGTRITIKSSLADSSTATIISSDLDNTGMARYASSSIEVATTGYILGQCIVNNASAGLKNYYILIGEILGGTGSMTLNQVGKDGDGNSFYAFRIK